MSAHDHPELVGPGVHLRRDPPGLVQDHHEQGNDGQQADRIICRALERTIAARAYGRSVSVSRVTLNTTNSTVGSVMAEKVLARLDLSCAYGLPVSSAAVAVTRLAREQQEPPPQDVAHVAQRRPVAGQQNSRTVR
jgi:hypothetical protein